jgi:hypothetical protein
MIKLSALLVFFILLIPVLLFADETIRGHYCYTYGDSESLKEARELTRTLAIRNAIESYSVFVNASVTVTNFTASNDLIQMLSTGQLKNIAVESHTEKDRTVCDIITAKVSPLEFEQVIKKEALRINNKVESTGIASNGCLKILSIKGDPPKQVGPEHSPYYDITVVFKKLSNCYNTAQYTIFIDYFDKNGEPQNGDSLWLYKQCGELHDDEIRAIKFIGPPHSSSYRVWLTIH